MASKKSKSADTPAGATGGDQVRALKKMMAARGVFEPSAADIEKAIKAGDVETLALALRLWSQNGKDRFWQLPKPDDVGGVVLALSREDVKLRLRRMGMRTPRGAEVGSLLDDFFFHVQEKRSVAWAGAIAGQRIGVTGREAYRLLVNHSFRLVEPVAGEWPMIRQWLGNFFDDDAAAQLPYFLAWLKTGIESIRDGVSRPGYILAIAGPAGTGKTFLQSRLITPLLGGREGNPLPFLRDRDTFNDDVCGNEHQLISELKGCKLDGQSRAELGEALKDLAMNPAMRLRAQYASAIMVETIRRVSVTLNNEPDKLKAFPAMSPDFADKVLLLLCKPGAMPIDTADATGWRKLGGAVAAELPAFVHFILHQWQMPAELLAGEHIGRFGHATYHHPALVAELFGQTPESELLWIIDQTPELWAEDRGWCSSEDIREALLSGPQSGKTAKHLSFAGAMGTYLNKLASKFPDRFQKKHTKRGNVWLIRGPGLA